jgi:hypothetical protein
MVIELSNQQSAQTVLHALDIYKARLRASIERTRRRLREYEQRYRVTTAYFLRTMAAEDLAGGDLEYVEWAGEAKLLASSQFVKFRAEGAWQSPSGGRRLAGRRAMSTSDAGAVQVSDWPTARLRDTGTALTRCPS